MPTAQSNGLDLEFDALGDAAAPPVLLIMGLGMPAAMWPEEFLQALLAQGMRVIRFDNRDCGGSTRFGAVPVPSVPLAIARALLADPHCFIFDEATSALDTLSEQLIQDALEKNLGGRTVIFIAHRLATVKNCDRILVMADGRVAQDGRYAELVAQPGLFQELVRGQSLRD